MAGQVGAVPAVENRLRGRQISQTEPPVWESQKGPPPDLGAAWAILWVIGAHGTVRTAAADDLFKVDAPPYFTFFQYTPSARPFQEKRSAPIQADADEGPWRQRPGPYWSVPPVGMPTRKPTQLKVKSRSWETAPMAALETSFKFRAPIHPAPG